MICRRRMRALPSLLKACSRPARSTGTVDNRRRRATTNGTGNARAQLRSLVSSGISSAAVVVLNTQTSRRASHRSVWAESMDRSISPVASVRPDRHSSRSFMQPPSMRGCMGLDRFCPPSLHRHGPATSPTTTTGHFAVTWRRPRQLAESREYSRDAGACQGRDRAGCWGNGRRRVARIGPIA